MKLRYKILLKIAGIMIIYMLMLLAYFSARAQSDTVHLRLVNHPLDHFLSAETDSVRFTLDTAHSHIEMESLFTSKKSVFVLKWFINGKQAALPAYTIPYRRRAYGLYYTPFGKFKSGMVVFGKTVYILSL